MTKPAWSLSPVEWAAHLAALSVAAEALAVDARREAIAAEVAMIKAAGGTR